jgi:hypothetical protein
MDENRILFQWNKTKYIYCGLVCCFLVTPLLLLSLFNSPGGDDFWIASSIKNLGFLETQVWFFENWTGRYSSTLAWSAFQYIAMHIGNYMWWYKILPVIFAILFYYWSIYFSLAQISREKQSRSVFALLFILFYLLKTPGVDNALYMVAGIIIYQIPNILTFLLIAIVCSWHQKRSNIYKIFFIIVGCLLTVFIVGSNEIAAVVTILCLLSALSLVKSRQEKLFLALLLIVAFVFTSISFLAPGNNVRLSTATPSFFPALIFTVLNGSYLLIDWSLDLGLIVITLFLGIFVVNNRKTPLIRIQPRLRLIICILWPVLFILPMFANYYNKGQYVAPPRVLDVMYFYFLTGWFVMSYLLLSSIKSTEKLNQFKESRIFTSISLILLLSLLVDSNFLVALRDLPESYKHHIEVSNRYQFIESEVNRDVVHIIVDPYKYKSKTLARFEIDNDKTHPFQKAISGFFGADTVFLSGPASWKYQGENRMHHTTQKLYIDTGILRGAVRLF